MRKLWSMGISCECCLHSVFEVNAMMERLRAMREDRDLNQEQLAKLLHVSQSSYSDYERGNTNIPVVTLKQLALFYGTSIDYLLELTDEPRPYPRRRKKQ